MAASNLIQGSRFSDARGKLNFFNGFKMKEIVRFYEIHPANQDIIRAWQAHKEEKKWFYCNSGAFIVNLIKIDNFDKPSRELIPERYILKAEDPQVLEVSGGYATGFKALGENAKLLVFSNFDLQQSAGDDFRFPPDHWEADWEVNT
ncbi:cupin domain-containing protein [Poritiphilus flavus]|uniref:dTDP-4-dehydrorhamnose 3,5-epimerase n=1 Tax=Poritiphilus flavus TaxID=2697053 RepID=A0A6L9ECF0_9FLAO|nr:hypothetical protein [Poritiphilus flavus]NAS12367.1 hypothetical protein [Poritiphilus flavus]